MSANGQFFVGTQMAVSKFVTENSDYVRRLFDQLLHCCFTSTETTRIIRDGEPRTATSTFTQLLSSESSWFVQTLLYVHRDHKDY